MANRSRLRTDVPLVQLRIFILLSVFFVVGGMFGILFLRTLSAEEWESVYSYLNSCLTLLRSSGVRVSCWRFLCDGARLYLIMLFFALVIWGVVGFPILFLERGFFLAFAVSCFWKVYGVHGFLLAFAMFGVPALLWAPAMFLLGSSGMGRAYLLFRREGTRDTAFLRRCLVCLFLILLSVVLEWLIVPALLRSLTFAVF